MAIREKTITYGFPMITTIVADAVVTNFTQITVFVPEASPTFTSAFVEIGFQDIITNTGGTIGEHRCGLRVGAAAYTTVTELDDITNSGENISGVLGPFDFTSHFTTNWTGTSMTCDVQVYFDQTTGTTFGMRNVTAVLYLTYTYDDSVVTNPTQIKTVRIPFDSVTGFLGTIANTTFDTYPALTGAGGLLCENTPTIRSYFFLIEANENGSNNSTDITISTNIDSGTAFVFGVQEKALISERWCRWIWLPSVIPSTTSSHTFQMWNNVGNRLNHPAVELIVTYEFNAASTTKVLNSLFIPIDLESPLGNTTTADASRHSAVIYCVEPGTLTLKHSAFRINWNTNTQPTNCFFRAGSQAYRTYSLGSSSITMCGMFNLQQRIDSGGAQGAGMTLARGKNTITVDGYSDNATNLLTNVNGYIILNYESDLSSQGIGSHNHSVWKVLSSWDAALSVFSRMNNFSFSIPETSYYINSVGVMHYHWTTSTSLSLSLDVECLSTEGQGGGYYELFVDAYLGDGELSNSLIWMIGHDIFRRFPQSIQTDVIDIETARDYRILNSNASAEGTIICTTYHSITYTISGTITGSDGVNNIILDLVRASDNVVLQTQTVPQNTTSYTFTVYDNTDSYYVTARQSSTSLGITPTGTAV